MAGYMGVGPEEFSGGLADPPPDSTQIDKVPASTIPMLAGIITSLDPTHSHLRASNHEGPRIPTAPSAPPSVRLSGISTWAPRGDISSLIKGGDDKQAFGELVFEAYPALKVPAASDNPIGDSPCGIYAGQFHSDRANTLAWSPCVKHPQPDGSVVETTHAAVHGGGTATAAFRIFPDNAYIALVASDYLVYMMDAGKSEVAGSMQSLDTGEHIGAVIKPSPFSDQALAAALTGPYVVELAK